MLMTFRTPDYFTDSVFSRLEHSVVRFALKAWVKSLSDLNEAAPLILRVPTDYRLL